MSLINILKSTSLKLDPWGHYLSLASTWNVELLTTTLWLLSSNQFFTHQIVHLSNPSLSNLEVRKQYRTMTKILQTVQVDKISHPFFVHWFCHSIIEGHHISQVWPALGKAVLSQIISSMIHIISPAKLKHLCAHLLQIFKSYEKYHKNAISEDRNVFSSLEMYFHRFI